MKEFINKIFSNQQVNLTELSQFITEYAELCEIKNTTSQHIQAAIQLIQHGIFDLRYACKNCASKLGLQVVELIDTKTGQLIYIKIQE
jgi:predicted transcriptional regulator YheO